MTDLAHLIWLAVGAASFGTGCRWDRHIRPFLVRHFNRKGEQS